MDYFCYVSEQKVDQYLSQIDKNEILESTEKNVNTKDSKSEFGLSGLFKILSGKYSFGRSDMFHKEVKYRENCVQKLLRLLNITVDVVDDFNWNVPVNAKSSLFYFKGSFSAEHIDSKHKIVSIVHRYNSSELVLDCSVRNFSYALNSPSENIGIVNSTNYSFFEKNIPIVFETVFILINISKNVFTGSPLFLMLSSDFDLIL